MNSNLLEFSVSEFSRSMKRIVEDAFGYVRIKGEIIGLKRASSNHLYFSLKDDEAQLNAVCFKNMAELIEFEMVDGLQVIVSGRVTTFSARSNYQIIVEKIEIAGVGALMEMIEKRRLMLLAEGIFAEHHKKPLPFFPKTIGIITSKTGAVIEDIKNRISARCPTNLLLYPVTVQGTKASAEIVAAIKYFNQLNKENQPELLIIARGGGSFFDLLPFNDEELVRAVFASTIPIISAIGHETDVTLIDYVADVRAATPSAAAEIATVQLEDLREKLSQFDKKLKQLPQSYLQQKSQKLTQLTKYLPSPQSLINKAETQLSFIAQKFLLLSKNFLQRREQRLASIHISKDDILQKINHHEQKLESHSRSINSSCGNNLQNAEIKLENLAKLLSAHNYQNTLKRGFALIKDEKNQLISSRNQVKNGQTLTIELHDGKLEGEYLVKN